MQIKNNETGNIFSIILLLFGCMGLVTVIAMDKLYWHTDMFAEGLPNFNPGRLIRSIVIFVSTLAIFWSLIGGKSPKFVLDEDNGSPIERLSILGALSASVIFLLLFILKPPIFHALSVEDGPIEWGSALFLFGSCIAIVISFFKSRNNLHISNITQSSLALLSLVFFVMAMEEVSWFQRVLDIDTPEIFGGNLQQEMNLHNFATNMVENIYYIGAFIFLVLLPFVRFFFPFVSNNDYLRTFVARPFIGIIGAIACAYNFDMWNIIFLQITFFSSIIVLFAFAASSSNSNESNIILLSIILITATQALFLLNGENFTRIWGVTEYKEFFIALVFFIYSLDVYAHINRAALWKNTSN